MVRQTLSYPVARRVSVTETIGGITYEDPYQWLEEENDEVHLWQTAQTELAEQTIRSFPHFDSMNKLLAELSQGSGVFRPWPAGGRWFRNAVAEGAENLVLMVSDEPLGAGKVLVDPNALSAERGVPVSIDWWYPSPDGRYVACGLSESGVEVCVIKVAEAETGKLLPDHVPGALHLHFTESSGGVAWLPDGSGFFYTGNRLPDIRWPCVWFHRLGSEAPAAPEKIDVGKIWPTVGVSDDGRWAFAITASPGPLDFKPGFICDLSTGDRVWRPFLRDSEKMVLGHFIGDRYVALTHQGAPRGRIVSIPIATASDDSTWNELIPEGDAAINGIGLAKSGLVVSELFQTRTRVRFFDFDGTFHDEMPLPGPGAVNTGTYAGWHGVTFPGSALVHSRSQSDELLFVYSALDRSPALYRYKIGASAPEQLTEPTHSLDFVIEQILVESVGGVSVPATIVHRRDLDRSTPQPTLISGYGNAGVSMLDGYSAEFGAWVLAGGVFVSAFPRGGGELGDGWRQDGRRANKQHTFDDIYAVAERLIADGITTPKQLALVGESGGSLLTGAAANQRPELWGAIVHKVPVSDLMRAPKDTSLYYAFNNELGDPSDPKEARWLYAYSAYHNVREGQRYPAMLLTAGAQDLRALPWHPRKLAARFQRATSGETPILLHVEASTGHGVTRPASVGLKIAALQLAFIMEAVGMTPSV